MWLTGGQNSAQKGHTHPDSEETDGDDAQGA